MSLVSPIEFGISLPNGSFIGNLDNNRKYLVRKLVDANAEGSRSVSLLPWPENFSRISH